jgi:hypothetical protein
VIIPSNPNELVGRFTSTETWTTKEEDNITGLGIRRFLGKIFHNDEWGYQYVSHSKDVVNMTKFYEVEILPLQDKFQEVIKSCKKEAKSKRFGLQKYVEEQIHKLDAELEKCASDQRALLSEQGRLEASIKENEGKKAWLEDFIKQLDAVLEV